MTQIDDPKLTTIEYYQTNAKKFVNGTINVDMSELYRPFLDLLPATGTILDAGCGSGRDTKFFSSQGFKVVAFDNSPELVKYASEYTGQDVLLLSFEEINFKNKFDGIWACASILHVSQNKMGLVLSKLGASLKPDGILYTSYKYGEGELTRKGRFFSDYTENSFDLLLKRLPEFKVIRYWKTADLRAGRSNEEWLNILIRKSD